MICFHRLYLYKINKIIHSSGINVTSLLLIGCNHAVIVKINICLFGVLQFIQIFKLLFIILNLKNIFRMYWFLFNKFIEAKLFKIRNLVRLVFQVIPFSKSWYSRLTTGQCEIGTCLKKGWKNKGVLDKYSCYTFKLNVVPTSLGEGSILKSLFFNDRYEFI